MLRGALWMLIYLGAIVLPLLALFAQGVPQGRGFRWDLSMGLGFAAMAMMAAQFAVTARFRRASAPFGVDVLYYFHRVLAIGALAIALGHFGILWIWFEEALGDLNPLTARWELTSGRVALAAFAGLVITSEFRKRLRLEYGLWRYLHVGLALLGFAAAVAHILGVGYYTDAPLKRALWLAVTLSLLGLTVWLRLVKPAQQVRHPWRVAENRAERGDARTLALEPVGHPGFAWRPGQFVWLTLRHSPFLLREHPFSITSAPEEGPRIELTIKPLGDFTSSIGDIREGEPAWLDGPYGVFSIDCHPDAPGFVFIAGGIGATPIMSNLRAMAARGDRRPALMFYCNPDWEGAAFREDLDALAARIDLTLVHVLEEAPEDWSGERGYLDEALLRRRLPPDAAAREHFLCGPAPMTSAARAGLAALGVPAWRIHSEIFELV